MNLIKPAVVLSALLLSGSAVFSAVVYELDFSTAKGDVKGWFNEQGWKNQGKILKMNPRFENGTQVLEAMGSDSGALIYEFEPSVFLKNAHHVVIEWGVDQYPKGADWSGPKDKTWNIREAIDVVITFGIEKISRGNLVVPNLPYFIGLFHADGEKVGEAYFGDYWQQSGRCCCISADGTKELVTTHFALSDKFKEAFGRMAPPVTGLAIKVDCKKNRQGRRTAFHGLDPQITFHDQLP
ncbi:hypothetical protein [Pontiella sulfatireligans]|uniref:DUF1080 domain-containing protein n=1 Tax=Pontiella sulfatireligans TaxID=2750658 RepID=A0A6C2UJL0_9BACT|nr:hypothetical protein [Pontiella sulfatireligans]VGO20288.1 hypothetical protein SCARR_02349 [Pontiella sulfatireligans]